MLNGEYDDVNAYRLNGLDGIGFASTDAFTAYYQDVYPDQQAVMKCESDPVYEQVRMDILENAGIPRKRLN